MSEAPTHATTKKIEDLVRGDVWSINPKAKKLVMATIEPNADVIVANELDGDKPGAQIRMAYSDYEGMQVCCHANVAPKGPSWTPELWQRVTLHGSQEGTKGIVINACPEVNVSVLWDKPVDNQWTSQHPLEQVCPIDELCDDAALQRAKEARALIKDLDIEEAKDPLAETQKSLQAEMAKTMASREKYRMDSEAKMASKIQKIAGEVINSRATDFKMMIEAGILSLTAGEEEGQIDSIPEMIDSHLDSIRMHVDAATKEEDLKIPVISTIMQTMADSMFKQYFLTRHAFIRPKGNKWMLISSSNEKLGIQADKKAAVRQLRFIEHKHRFGLED